MTKTEVDRGLRGLEVAITGRLASMTRDEARERLAAAGASYAAAPGDGTALLVVGQGGPPLGDDGRLTASLRSARELRDAGAAIEIVPEEELLARLDIPERRAELDRLYTTAQLARILDVPQREIRRWVRHGLIEPARVVRRLAFFDFAQVAGAKALSRLSAAGVTPARIGQSLRELEGWWPEAARALAQFEALEHGRLAVRTEDGALAETTGQLRLEFDEDEAASPGGPLALTAHRDAQVSSAPVTPGGASVAEDPARAELWFRRGIRLEEENRPEEAILAYARAFDHGPPRAELAFNLGNVLYASERPEEAAQCFALATEIDPEYVEAWNNLGNVLAETKETADAVQAFERALDLEPDYADAHLNLAETLADRGDWSGAREHWQAYLALDPFSVWAAEVRVRLRRTE